MTNKTDRQDRGRVDHDRIVLRHKRIRLDRRETKQWQREMRSYTTGLVKA